jgi:formate dehydrogenase
LHAALIAYFEPLRMAAQACDKPELAALLPGIVAQPPFSTYVAYSHVLVFFSAVISPPASGSDHVDLQAAIDRGITVAEVTYSNSISISEHVVRMILGPVRNYIPS